MRAPSPFPYAPLIEAAVRAPSSHNTQPWLFRVQPGSIELYADRRRALPVNDPRGRELAISCGAALFNLRVAAADEGLAADVELCPRPSRADPDETDPDEADPDEADLLARVTLRGDGEVEPLAELRAAVGERHTTRAPFEKRPLPDRMPAELEGAARAEGVRLALVPPGEVRRRVASLVARGGRLQFANPRWRRELAGWMRAPRSGEGLAVAAVAAPVARFVVRHFDLGGRVAKTDERLALEAPLVGALVTEGDGPEAWLRSGQALERVLLLAARRGWLAGYLNQPCQVDELRPELAQALAPGGRPQVLIRLGPPRAPAKTSARRALDEVVHLSAAAAAPA